MFGGLSCARGGAVLAAVLLTALAGAATAEDACATYGWDVTHERALFGAAPKLLAAGKTSTGAPQLALDRLYELTLAAQPEVTFALVPETPHADAHAYAGLARFTLATPGRYRIALDQGLWVDVVADGRLIPSGEHQGRHGCSAPHKIVEFLLPAGTPLTLQLSAGGTGT